ncbi:MAG: non-canonical purine NTP pyrophosphatase [Parcubacteria group bacterium]|nr:non-canonical purine NTP pyrophosphatase [Parcubacteria group bacterium]
MNKNLTLITSNKSKAAEASRYLGFSIKHIALDLHEIQSLDLKEIVKEKVLLAYQKINSPVLVEDVSLVFTAFGNLPGPLIKWFFKELGNEGLARLVDGKDRSCIATVCYGYHDGAITHLIEGEMKGVVAENPKGDTSFGWSPIFIPEGMSKTYGELLPEERDPIAMRRIALEKLKNMLSNKK